METAPHLASEQYTLQHLSIAAIDGYQLAASIYQPFRESSHVVLLNSGTGVKRVYYHKFASFLAEQGFTVLVYDYRGIGESLREHIRTFDTSISEWGEKDCTAALAWVHEHFPDKQCSIIGHSAGGKIPGFVPNNNDAQAIVTIAVPNSYWGLWHWWGRRGYFLFVQFIMPALSHLLNYFPSRRLGLGENYPKGVALQWSRWSRRKAYLLHPKHGHHPNYFAAFRGNVLAISFADDIVATGQAVESFMNFYENAATRTHWHIVPKQHGIKHIGHSGFFRAECLPLWSNLAEWLRGSE
jgi:predicted alpha/beta hydrolase